MWRYVTLDYGSTQNLAVVLTIEEMKRKLMRNCLLLYEKKLTETFFPLCKIRL
jgi:hypothetical protein